MNNTIKKLSVVLADTYALYLKTQNYHWHVSGPQFKVLHELFEEQYQELAEAIDDIAERIRILGEKAPATFSEFNALKTLADGDANQSAEQMLLELHHDHGSLISALKDVLIKAQNASDEGTVALLSERIASHEKTRWMLGVSRKQDDKEHS